ncbi:MAG: BamA/OMP85 family outer membrane protein, partial [Bacteroidota bacterium]
MTEPDRIVRSTRPLRLWLYALLLLGIVSVRPSAAQHPLYLADERTTVREVSFRFPDTQTFERDRLKLQIATQAPSTLDRLREIAPLIRAPRHPFSPIELQRDVARLRNFYNRNGFLHPEIDYPASQLDTARNSIHVIFTVWEGPPLIIQDFGFRSPDGNYALEEFEEGEERQHWIEFRDRLGLQVGSRFTHFERTRVQDRILTWLQDRGYAFAEVEHETVVDSVANTVDLFYIVDPGPVAYVSEIEIEGNESVRREIILRELPLSEGDRFDRSRMVEGQRRLFALSLFRVAIADIPPQTPSNTVSIRYRVREARPRHVSAQTGYGRNGGLQFQTDWRHRNFLGGARQLTASIGARSGLLARPVSGRRDSRSFTASISVRQPYIITGAMSGLLQPFYTYQASATQAIEFQEIGLNTTLIYEVLPFRTVRLQHTVSRAYPLGDTQIGVVDPGDLPIDGGIDRINIYDRSVTTISATLGRANVYIEPTRGFLIRPSFESGGIFLTADVQYVKGSGEAAVYMPLGGRFNFSARLMGGFIEPLGASRDQTDPQTQYRFGRIRMYGGGPSDVR